LIEAPNQAPESSAFVPCPNEIRSDMQTLNSLFSVRFNVSIRAGVFLALVSMASYGFSQDTAFTGFPYNPDSNNDGLIEVNDLLEFLIFYGESFNPEDTLPIALGGTSANTAAAARDSLGLMSIQDSIWGNPSSMWTWSNGSMRIMQRFAQGNNILATGTYAHASGTNTSATGAYSNAQNRQTSASATCSSAEGEGTTASGTASHAEGMLSQASALAAHAEGYNTDATSNYSHSEGYATLADATASHAQGYQTNASGLYSHAEGRQTEASGTSSHSEGQSTVALGDLSHAEGYETEATGYASHSGGYGTLASGLYSRATGRSTEATATASAAFGNETIADQENSVVLGQFNLAEAANVVFAIGNGTSDSTRSNVLDIHTNGTLRLQGTAEIEEEVFIGEMAIGSTMDSLINTLVSMQETILFMQAQIEVLTNAE